MDYVFGREEDRRFNIKNLEASISNLEALKPSILHLAPESQRELEERVELGINACHEQIQTLTSKAQPKSDHFEVRKKNWLQKLFG
jgi:hypothetical protein